MSKLEMFGWAVGSLAVYCAFVWYVLIPICSGLTQRETEYAEYVSGRCNGFEARKNTVTGVVQRPVGKRDGMRWMDMPYYTWTDFVEDK